MYGTRDVVPVDEKRRIVSTHIHTKLYAAYESTVTHMLVYNKRLYGVNVAREIQCKPMQTIKQPYFWFEITFFFLREFQKFNSISMNFAINFYDKYCNICRGKETNFPYYVLRNVFAKWHLFDLSRSKKKGIDFIVFILVKYLSIFNQKRRRFKPLSVCECVCIYHLWKIRRI